LHMFFKERFACILFSYQCSFAVRSRVSLIRLSHPFLFVNNFFEKNLFFILS